MPFPAVLRRVLEGRGHGACRCYPVAVRTGRAGEVAVASVRVGLALSERNWLIGTVRIVLGLLRCATWVPALAVGMWSDGRRTSKRSSDSRVTTISSERAC